MFSIIIPTLNNRKYLEKCIYSLKKNSKFNHEIIVHVNIGNDDTLKFLKDNKIKFTYTKFNAGICKGVNLAASKATKEYILYAHDDFYFCPEWDQIFLQEVQKIGHNFFYLSGLMIERQGKAILDCGNTLEDFDENKLLNEYKNANYFNFQGSTWAPHLIHKDIWQKVGGFSEEFYPGTGSDPDLNMKLWRLGIRIFKGLNDAKVYHFGSIVTRRSNKSIKTETGSKGNKIFLKKWGISIKFFRKHYLRSETKYLSPLQAPKKDINYFVDLIKCKIHYFYVCFYSIWAK